MVPLAPKTSTCNALPRFTKHLLAFSQVYQAPAWLFPRFSLAVPQVYQAPAWLFPSFTKHLRQSAKIWFFVKMTPFFWFAAACGGGAFLFLYKETFLYEVTALCGRASEGPFTLFFMCILVDARFATLAGQANH